MRWAIPGYDLETYHMNTFHDDHNCIKDDIFAHKNIHRFADILKVQRKHPHTEEDLMAGKFRHDPNAKQEDYSQIDDFGGDIHDYEESNEDYNPDGDEYGGGLKDPMNFESTEYDDKEPEFDDLHDQKEDL